MSPIPSFLEPQPEPRIENRLYHGTIVALWRGTVRISKVQGWANNPRLELEMKRWANDYAEQKINQEQLYDIMKRTKGFRLKELSDNIKVNGLREPIVLTYNGKLLDGNRRYFAVKFAYEKAGTPAEKENLEKIPAFVLMKDATEQDEQNILVEENFSPSLKIEWPDYVKAQHIRRAYDEEGLSISKIASKFGWSAPKVRDTIEIGKITDRFITYATGREETGDEDEDSRGGGLGLSGLDAENMAAQNYQYFNEAKKSFLDHLYDDSDFAEMFYNLIAKENFFKSFHEVRCTYDGYNDPTGRIIMEKGEPGGGKDLKALIQMKKSKIERDQTVEEKITKFAEFLNTIKAEEINNISDATFRKLQDSLVLVKKLVDAAKNK